MFLDPEPVSKRKKDMSSGFFSSQRPVTSSRNHAARTSWRKASLHEKTKSQNQRQEPNLTAPAQSATVRLVNPSPSPESPPRNRYGEGRDDANQEDWEDSPTALPHASRSAHFKEASVLYPATSAARREDDVSETHTLANEAQSLDNAPGTTLSSDEWEHELSPPGWRRRNTSSGYCSQASTLQDSEIASSKKSRRSERYSSFSQLSTLRGTPTPHEQGIRERAEGEASARSGLAPALQTLQENFPERPARLSTIRPVPASDTSSPTDPVPGAQSLETSPVRPAQTAPSEQPSSNEGTPPQSSKSTLSAGSIQPFSSTPNWRDVTATPASHHQPDGSPESQAISEPILPNTSSPNFIAYTPDSVQPISKRDPIHSATSIESIHSRLKYGPIGRPDTGRSHTSSASRASLTSSNDTLPPLRIPKKRLRRKAASESLSFQAEAQALEEAHADEAMDNIDTLPFPKRPFSSHLSTIASESEQSRSASQHFSHFSLGSGVLTGDDASSLPLSPGHRRQWSAPAESIASGPQSNGTRGTSSSEFQEDAGDMTLGIFREQSAMPEPLFKTNPASGSKATDAPRRYDGPLPPLPPIPKSRDSDENFDTLSELQAPALQQKRSGRSLRARSNSTPTHSRQLSQVSYVESDRNSQGSTLFPTWAKRFYSGTHTLQSKTSFGSLSAAGKRPVRHQRGDSSWTDRSITSRLGTGYSNVESSSPVSSHFLPAIFRPQTRKRSLEHQRNSRDSRFSKIRKSGNSRRSRDRPSQDARDSMAIHRDPLPQVDYEEGPKDSATEILPSGQPKWGPLKDSDSPRRDENGRRPRLPRRYSKQRQWDQMEFPRPMTKDRLSDFGVHDDSTIPRLAPSKRTSQNRLSGWRAPSFVSSLDTLITSRHNRQILLFMLGFICPLTWMLGAVLPLPRKPVSAKDLEANLGTAGQSEEDVQMAMMKHEAGDAERRWREERVYYKARWWRVLNRVMSVVGVGIIAAVIALAVIATT